MNPPRHPRVVFAAAMRGLLLSAAALLTAPSCFADEALWNLLGRGGQVIMIRHALTTAGVGDPEGMKLDDCSTQRNLSDEGRAQAGRLGQALRARGVPIERVLSSPWCRCIETARLAFRGSPEILPALGNLFGRPERAAGQVAQLKPLVARVPPRGNLVLVSHGSTISALTGVSPATSEMVVLTPQGDGRFAVAGRLQVP